MKLLVMRVSSVRSIRRDEETVAAGPDCVLWSDLGSDREVIRLGVAYNPDNPDNPDLAQNVLNKCRKYR